ncbi:Mediator of RNA polymerase II transcription subunit 23 [Polyplax serrata]|uniref:Mediator of RNA polymerase II transcription subunit 23 n=1 Tax=Polyplax serrata TaxID=468196 RepID=A0ABR1ATH0_POLSC
MSSTETQITNIVNEILKVEAMEEAFSCFLVHRPELENEKMGQFHTELQTAFTGVVPEQQEAGIRQFLQMAAGMSNPSRLQFLLQLLEKAVHNNVIPARLVCECILSCEKLQLKQQDFWVQCFHLMRKIIVGVDYKGVREIMKGCREKAALIPGKLNAGQMPQITALESVMEFIFDRNACLLPAYFIVNEIQKAYPDNKNWPHWKLANLLSSFVESFRPCAQMVSIVGHSKLLPVVEHSGYADHLSPWKLDPSTLKFTLKGILPYDKELVEPQTGLLRYVLEQPYSRDMVCCMLGLVKQHKQRCVALEEQLVALVVVAMERSETETSDSSHWLWLHLSSQLIYFVLFQFASFPNIVMALHDKLSNFLPVLKLYDLLYPEKEPLPVPDVNKAVCTHQMAMTCIWIHLLKKAQADHLNIQRPIPLTLKIHHEFLQHLVQPNNSLGLCMGADYRIALLCNAYSTNQEYFTRPMAALVETILGAQKSSSLPPGPTTPLSMAILDSLTVHSKMSLIHSIVTHVVKQAQSKSILALAPALVETYSRLLVYTEIESLGIKGFISHLLPTVFKHHAWGILYTLLEMFSYRMHHIQPHYRVQLLSHLHSLAAVPQTNQTQLHLWYTEIVQKTSLTFVESTALRLITGLGSAEVQPQLSRFLNEPKTLVSAESEELNRALVLTLARSMHVTGTGSDSISGTWCKELLSTIMQNTPHSWANHTLQSFPAALHDFFQHSPVQKENKPQLKKAVEEEYRNWASMNNENDIIAHFSVAGTPPLFICLLWKMILETDRITSIAYKILERIGARALSAHLRKFCDYLVFEFANSRGEQHVNKCVDALNDMIWKYNIVTIDRLVLCLALRTQEGSEAQVCFFIIQLLLLKAAELRNRVQDFVKENSPEHWKQSNWHEKHLAFHRKYPEKFAPEGILEQSSGASSPYHSLPVYFGNVCLRFLPVFDIVIHRYLELPPVAKSLETLLEHLGCLYKFHDRPVTYLYNTLHYYDKNLRERPGLKRKLVAAILGALKDIRPPGWSLSEAYIAYMTGPGDEVSWLPDLDYYIKLIRRIVESILLIVVYENTPAMNGSKAHFPATDWRFNEFPNPAAHALYVTCVELMATPVSPSIVVNNLLDVVSKGYSVIPWDQIHLWVNSIGLVLAALPESYWTIVDERLIEVMTSNQMTNWPYHNSAFQIFNFSVIHDSLLENKFAYMLALAHAMWYHAGVGQISTLPTFVKEKAKALIKTEEQFLFLCHLVGPFLQRLNAERPRCVLELTIELYELLEQVDKAVPQLKYMDPICDLLYPFVPRLKV